MAGMTPPGVSTLNVAAQHGHGKSGALVVGQDAAVSRPWRVLGRGILAHTGWMSQAGEHGFRDGPASTTPSGLRLAGLLALAVAAAMGVSLFTGGWNSVPQPTVLPLPSPTVSQTREPSRPIGAASIQRCPVTLGGLVITGPRVPHRCAGVAVVLLRPARAVCRGRAPQRWQLRPARRRRHLAR